MSWLGVPLEVADAVRDTFGVGIDVEQIHYFRKNEKERGAAWAEVQAKAPTTVVRKCHTDHYWVWFDSRVDNPHARKAYEAKLARERAGSAP